MGHFFSCKRCKKLYQKKWKYTVMCPTCRNELLKNKGVEMKSYY